ncbi:hypothetical protein [Suttonella ornithocola]|uniref:Uncharacterized protein n=1 Tax=Suttonella ornithocola TaxID=279832 RepID=A0A380MNI4_9GAMM|nr:hypothetical protein [Suttonella ornithocola]SUO93463.1 Uncharacterised protein [Suttonella ornithocola]SUO97368.1 Uncharacterised protein [Suttonella ornithocola]
MFRIIYIVQSLETGEFLSAVNGEASFTYDLTKAYQFSTVNDAINHARIIESDLEHISIIPQILIGEKHA